MSTFLQVMGGIFCLGLLLGGAWIGLCWAVDHWKSRYRPLLGIRGRFPKPRIMRHG